MSGYFYKGRHRAPTDTSRNLAVVASTAALALPAVATAAQAAPDSVWDRLAQCESTGNWAINSGNGYSGGLQFAPSTWAAFRGNVPGTPARAHQASREQQIAVAEYVLDAQGWGAWPACSSKLGLRGNAAEPGRRASGATPAPPRETARSGGEAARPVAPAPRAATSGRAADGSGTYVCGPSTYFLAACDPGDEGEVKQYPLYDGHGKHSAGTVKAASGGGKHRAGPPADLDRRNAQGRGTFTCDTARLGYDSCDIATLGQRVAYPLFD